MEDFRDIFLHCNQEIRQLIAAGHFETMIEDYFRVLDSCTVMYKQAIVKEVKTVAASDRTRGTDLLRGLGVFILFDAMFLTKSRLKLLTKVIQISSMLDNFKLDASENMPSLNSTSDEIVDEIKQCNFVKAFSILQAHSGFNKQDQHLIRLYKILANLNTICTTHDENSAEQDQLFLQGIRENKSQAMTLLNELQTAEQVSPLIRELLPLLNLITGDPSELNSQVSKSNFVSKCVLQLLFGYSNEDLNHECNYSTFILKNLKAS